MTCVISFESEIESWSMLERLQAAPYTSEESFASLYENNYRSVFRYVYGLLGGQREEAEDISAEAFMKAWDARKRFFGTEEQALSWLFTIAKRCLIDRWRKSRYQAINLDDVVIMAEDCSPEESTLILEQSGILMNLLSAMSEDKREVLVLRYMLGWSVNRIADYLDKSPNTVSQSIRRSLQSLREDWPEQD